MEEIAEWGNLRLAFYLAARGRRHSRQVRSYAADLDRHLEELSARLLNCDFPVGRMHQFLIRDPKERLITAPIFEERVMHHAVMNQCEPEFDRWMIADTFACRKGKGREAAIVRAQDFARRNDWYLKLDARKYFDSISHSVLIRRLERRFSDDRLLDLLFRIITAYRGQSGCGLPIGALTSQHFANFYLNDMDRFIKEFLKVKSYVRYMDDLVIWGKDRDRLKQVLREFQTFAADELRLAFKVSRVCPSDNGIEFLGSRIFKTHIELNRRSKVRWRRRLRVLERAERLGLITELELQQRLTSLVAFAKSGGAKSWRFRKAMLKQ